MVCITIFEHKLLIFYIDHHFWAEVIFSNLVDSVLAIKNDTCAVFEINFLIYTNHSETCCIGPTNFISQAFILDLK